MNLESIKNILDNLNIEMEQIKSEQNRLVLDQSADKLFFNSDYDCKRHCYLEGKLDILRQLSETIKDMYFDSDGDFTYIKSIYGDSYINFLEGATDAFKGLSKYFSK